MMLMLMMIMIAMTGTWKRRMVMRRRVDWQWNKYIGLRMKCRLKRVIWHQCPQKYFSVAVKHIIQLIFSKCHVKGSSEFEALKEISNGNERNPDGYE